MDSKATVIDPFADLVDSDEFFDPDEDAPSPKRSASSSRGSTSAVKEISNGIGDSKVSDKAPVKIDTAASSSPVIGKPPPGPVRHVHRRAASLQGSLPPPPTQNRHKHTSSAQVPSSTRTNETDYTMTLSPASELSVPAPESVVATSNSRRFLSTGSTSSDVRGFAVPRDESRHAAFLGIHALAEDAVYDDERSGKRDRKQSDGSEDSDVSDIAAPGVPSMSPTEIIPPSTSRPSSVELPSDTAVAAAPSASDRQEFKGPSPSPPLPLSLTQGTSAFKPAASRRSIHSSGKSVASADSHSAPHSRVASDLSNVTSVRGRGERGPDSAVAIRSDSDAGEDRAAPSTTAAVQPPERVSFWTATLRRFGWAPRPLPAGMVRSDTYRRAQTEINRLVLVQRLPHYSTQVVRARVGKIKAKLRAQQAAAAADEQASGSLDRKSSGRSSALSDGVGSRASSSNRGSEPRGQAVESVVSKEDAGSGGLPVRAPPTKSQPDAISASGDTFSQLPDTASIGGTSLASATAPGGMRSNLPTTVSATAPLTEAIWSMKFSLDGQFMAVAGGSEAGAILRVWKVRAWDAPVKASRSRLSRPLVTHGSPLFDKRPWKEYMGHQTHIVDIAWSRSNLLLSASMDSFVRLWHVMRTECLHKYQHPDCVTAVAFHPSEDNFFVTGCLDKKLRIWSLETGRVVLWQPTASMITSVAFSPDARLVAVGLYNGMCMLYKSDGLRYHTTVECKNRKGKDKKGRKVTGLEFDALGANLLISTNDSRIRLVSMDNFSQVYKYSGLRNNNMQIRATFDNTGDRIISGSEDRRVYVWRVRNDLAPPSSVKPGIHVRQKVRACEWFAADDGEQPGALTTHTAARGPLLCGCGVDEAATEPSQPPVAPRTAAMVAGTTAVMGATPSLAAHRVTASGADEIDPDAEDLEDRAELQAYYTSGRIATTVAVFVPANALAINRPLSAVSVWKCPPTLQQQDHDRLSGVMDERTTGDVVRAYHVMIAAADSRGFIRVYENTAPRRRV